jgi:hypothetical protein
VRSEFSHGTEVKAEEIALHQKYLTLLVEMKAAVVDGDEREIRRLKPLLERAHQRWITMSRRVARDH